MPVSISVLGTAGIAAATFVVLVMALLTSWADRRSLLGPWNSGIEAPAKRGYIYPKHTD